MTGTFDEEGQALLYLFKVHGISWLHKALLAPLRLAAVLGYKVGRRRALVFNATKLAVRKSNLPTENQQSTALAIQPTLAPKSPSSMVTAPQASALSVAVVMPYYGRDQTQVADLTKCWTALKGQTLATVKQVFLVDDAGPIPAPDQEAGGAVQQACPCSP